MVIGNTEEGTTGYGNMLPTVLSVFQPTEWWVDTGANVHVCADISMFTSYQARGSSVMMGNGLHATVRALLRRFACFLDKSDYTMGDINDSHGGAAGATFPVAMYVLFLSYLALLLVPCSDLMHVLSLMCMVKYACAFVMLLSVIKLTR